MRRVWCWVALCGLVCAVRAVGQSEKDLEHTLKDSVLKKQLVLKNFGGEDRVHAAWNGTSLEFDTSRWSKAAVIEIDSVKCRDRQITMKGVRHTLLYGTNGQLSLFNDAEPVEIDIDVPDGTGEQAALGIENALFFDTTEDALAAIPAKFSNFVPYRVVSPMRQVSEKTSGCVMKPPVAVRTPDPEMTDKMRRQGYKGAVGAALTVNTSGQPENLWIVESGGHDANQQAVGAIARYQFRPATCDGVPKAVVLRVQVNFEVTSGQRH